MELLSAAAFHRLTADAELFAGTVSDPRLYALPDGRIVKLLRLKRFPLLARLAPPARRFQRNAERLAELGIPVIAVESTFHCPELHRQGVIYAKLAGETLAECLTADDAALWDQLAAFVARLHRHGIYFRSLHLGNILRLPAGTLGLIDILDLRFRRPPLGAWRRARNFLHLLRRKDHQALFRGFGIVRFIHLYATAAGLAESEEKSLAQRVLRRVAE